MFIVSQEEMCGLVKKKIRTLALSSSHTIATFFSQLYYFIFLFCFFCPSHFLSFFFFHTWQVLTICCILFCFFFFSFSTQTLKFIFFFLFVNGQLDLQSNEVNSISRFFIELGFRIFSSNIIEKWHSRISVFDLKSSTNPKKTMDLLSQLGFNGRSVPPN